MFLKITGPDIPGESTDNVHPGEIEVLSYSHGHSMAVSPPSTAGSRTSERASFGDFVITKLIDKSTPKLFESVAKGTPHAEMVLSVSRADGKGGMIEFLKYTLSDVVLSSQQISGSDGGGIPVESISLAYGVLKYEYKPTDPKTGAEQGVVPFAFDVGANKVV
jgi:type VI secretion system Hcp family effector